MIYKLLNQRIQIENLDLSTPQHAHNTRFSCSNLFIKRKRLNYGKQTLEINGVKHWNTIPEEIKVISSLASFKTCIYNHILQEQTNRVNN